MRWESFTSASTGDHAGDAAVGQLALDREQVRLGVVDQHQRGRAEASDLAHELGADRAAGAGHQHAAAGHVRADLGQVEAHRLAAEQVLDLHVAQSRHQRVGAEQLLGPGGVCTGMPFAWQTSTTTCRRAPGADGIAITTSSGSVSRRTRSMSSIVPITLTLWSRRPCFAGSSSRIAISVYPESPLAHLAHDQLTGVAGADHEHLVAADERGGVLRHDARERPGRDQEQPGQHQVEHDHAARQRVVAATFDGREQPHRAVRHDPADQQGPAEREHVGERRVAPPPRVDAQHDQDDDLHRDEPPPAGSRRRSQYGEIASNRKKNAAYQAANSRTTSIGRCRAGAASAGP